MMAQKLGHISRKVDCIDADRWAAPTWVEDSDVLKADTLELGGRYARRYMDEKIGNRSEYDCRLASADIVAAGPALKQLQRLPGAGAHIAAALAAAALATLKTIPSSEWRCTSRENVRPDGQIVTQQLTLGLCLTQSYFNGIPMPTCATARYPGLCTVLLQYLRSATDVPDDFLITSIQLTKNLQTKPHCDANNFGPSYIVGFGQYQGGETFVEQSAGSSTRQLRENVESRGAVRYRNMV